MGNVIKDKSKTDKTISETIDELIGYVDISDEIDDDKRTEYIKILKYFKQYGKQSN